MNFCPALLLAAALPAGSAAADGSGWTNRRDFHPFNPAPSGSLRPLAQFDTPFTLDAGHAQVEIDAVAYARDRRNKERSPARVDTWSFGATTLRLGLLPDIEAQVAWQPHVRVLTRALGVQTQEEGAGAFSLRAKLNVWGNDGGPTALALMPFLDVPDSENHFTADAIEGGIALPFDVSLSGGWTLSFLTGAAVRRDTDGVGRHADWTGSLTVEREITTAVRARVAFDALLSTERHAPWVGQIEAGVLWLATDHLLIDAGVVFGVTRAANDFSTFLTFGWRF